MNLNIWWVHQPKSHRKPNLFQMVQMKRCEWRHDWERSGLRQHPKTSTSRTSYRTERQRKYSPEALRRFGEAAQQVGGTLWTSITQQESNRKKRPTILSSYPLTSRQSSSSCIQVKTSQEETLGDADRGLASQPEGRAVRGEKWRWGSGDNHHEHVIGTIWDFLIGKVAKGSSQRKTAKP